VFGQFHVVAYQARTYTRDNSNYHSLFDY
jgi:hypothetical protein